MATKKIKDLMKDMEQSILIIPSFQRDYVWKKEQIAALFDSLMRKLPVSSLLFWKLNASDIREIPFKFLKFFSVYDTERRENEDATPTAGNYYAVIDGQQRLTSIFIGFMGGFKERKKYSRKNSDGVKYVRSSLYLRLEKMPIESPEESVYDFRFLTDEQIAKMRQLKSTSNDLYPIYVENENYYWLKVSSIPTADEDLIYKWKDELDQKQGQVVSSLYNLYHHVGELECIEWDGKIDEAISVFVRYNSKGTPLTPGQVMISIMSEFWPTVREEFKQLQSRVKTLGFDIKIDYIVKALLTVFTPSPKNNIKAINKSVTNIFEENWIYFTSVVIKMFSDLKNKGFDAKTLTSYNATLPILFFLYYKKNNYRVTDENSRIISIWLIRTLLMGAFSGQSDKAISDAITPLRTMKEKDIDKFPADEITDALKGNAMDVDPISFLDIQKDDVRAKLLMSILFPEKWGLLSELDHMHPINKFKKNVDSEEFRIANSVINLQPLDGAINAHKNGSSFEAWIKETFQDNTHEKEEYLKYMGVNPSLLKFEQREEMWNKRRDFMKNLLLSKLQIKTPQMV